MPAEPTILNPRERRLVLAVVGLALMAVVSAVSGLNVALPDLARSTGASQTQIQWIVDAYTMVFAGLLLSAGAIGDRFGRRRILLAGLLVFGGAALGALFSHDPDTLIGFRALMGVGAACIMPTTLSIITTSFPPRERAQAVGVWVGIAGGGAVLGLLASGILLEFFRWSSFFGLNVVLAAVAFVGALAFVPDSREAEAPSLDPVGALLSLVGVTTLIFGIIEGPDRGWTDALVVAGLAGGLIALAAFVAWELRTPRPLLDPRLFLLRGFGTGSLSITVQFFAAFGFFFVILQYLQYVAGFSPLKASLAMLPMPVVLIPLARRAPLLAPRLGINRLGAVGLTLLAAGLGVISLAGVAFHYPLFLGGLLLFGAGMGLAGTPATAAIVSSLPRAKQGVASAVNDVSREFGSALGIAVLGSVLNDRYRSGIAAAASHLPASAAAHARASIAFVQDPRVAHFGRAGIALKTSATSAFVDAASISLRVAAVMALLAAVYVAVRAPRRVREGATEPAAAVPARAAGR
jgi:EmrB/QacA subfamily drug resistance transporter